MSFYFLIYFLWFFVIFLWFVKSLYTKNIVFWIYPLDIINKIKNNKFCCNNANNLFLILKVWSPKAAYNKLKIKLNFATIMLTKNFGGAAGRDFNIVRSIEFNLREAFTTYMLTIFLIKNFGGAAGRDFNIVRSIKFN